MTQERGGPRDSDSLLDHKRSKISNNFTKARASKLGKKKKTLQNLNFKTKSRPELKREKLLKKKSKPRISKRRIKDHSTSGSQKSVNHDVKIGVSPASLDWKSELVYDPSKPHRNTGLQGSNSHRFQPPNTLVTASVPEEIEILNIPTNNRLESSLTKRKENLNSLN